MSVVTEKEIPTTSNVVAGRHIFRKAKPGLYFFKLGSNLCFDRSEDCYENLDQEKHVYNVWADSQIRNLIKRRTEEMLSEELLFNFEELDIETISGRNKTTKTRDRFFLPSESFTKENWWSEKIGHGFCWKRNYFVMLREGKGIKKIAYWDREQNKIKLGNPEACNREVYVFCKIKENTKFLADGNTFVMLETEENIPGIDLRTLEEYLK